MLDKLKAVWEFMWTDHGQKTLGFVQITFGVFAVSNFIPRPLAEWFILVNGLLIAWKGFFSQEVTRNVK